MTRLPRLWNVCWPILLLLVTAAPETGPSWDLPQRCRVEVMIGAAGHARRDLPAEVELDFARLLKAVGDPGRLNEASLRVAEVDARGKPLDAEVPFQFDARPGGEGKAASAAGTLVLLLKGETAADARRSFRVYFDTAGDYRPVAPPAQVKLTDRVVHGEQESYRIETPAGTWFYHQRGAGFASLQDRDGNDWLSYRPTGGSAGHFRGIPNLVHPEGYFHPGGLKCTSRVTGRGPLRVQIASEAEEGKWACTWDIFPGFARLTVRKAPQPYWFLYEGTPGGKLEEDGDYYVLSTGEKRPASAKWDRDIPTPEWLYFGDRQLKRVLYLVHHEDDEHIDAYYPMQGNMTVFGFGRQGLRKFLEKVPAHFTVGLCEETEHEKVKTVIEGAYRPVEVKVGAAAAKGK